MTGTPAAGADDGISEETRMLVARVRERAASAPGADEIAALLTAPRSGLTQDEIRQLGRDAIAVSQQASYLLGVLAGKLDRAGEP